MSVQYVMGRGMMAICWDGSPKLSHSFHIVPWNVDGGGGGGGLAATWMALDGINSALSWQKSCAEVSATEG